MLSYLQKNRPCEIDQMVPQKSKDIDAFSCLYDTYAPALYGVILKLTPDVQLASNILEKSFVKIRRRLNDYDASKGRLFSLMLRVTVEEYKKQVVPPINILPILSNNEEHPTRLHQKMQGLFPDSQEQ